MPARPNTRRRPRPPGSTLRKEPIDPRQKALDAFIDSRAWRSLRAAYVAEHPLCEPCRAEGRTVQVAHVHHKQDRADHPDLAMVWENLQSLCKPCHSRATLAERARRD